MARLTLDGLRTILVACAGEDDGVDLSGDILDITFEELGYDSLALMESASRIERELGVALADGDINEELTPRILLDLVNGAQAEAA
ncbi:MULTISPECIES: acyl carrier protein [Streptomyces]|uniref:Acyl carrier protein n=1 Tax=Streptomyces lateritius TaxID=67313 RepID=A0ABW6Y7G5_9ACTN|nr:MULTISPECIES: acyl carrier protein [Streptomyces]QGZ49860.1 actinorhodin polyketide synthase [Streptomyces sp. QHH-9511]QJD07448.1 acyl carrier protein [Streptomyces sp.]GGT68444.1 actinorhodin polyketide synthase acyl carrier protein [Streptomyces lateritius]